MEASANDYISSLGKKGHTLTQTKLNLCKTVRGEERLKYNIGRYQHLRSELKNKRDYEQPLTLQKNLSKFKCTRDMATKKFFPVGNSPQAESIANEY